MQARLLLVAFSFFLIAKKVLDPSPSIDGTFGLPQCFATLLVCSVWLLSLFSYGQLLSLKLARKNLLVSLSLGTLFYLMVSIALSASCILGDRWSFIYQAIVFAPLLFTKINFAPITKSRAILGAFLLVFLVAALLPHPYQDSYAYHLYAPWRWWKEGQIFLLPDNPSALHASYWEYLNFWVFALLGSSGSALYAAQIFAQLVHCVLGLGGFLLAFVYVCESLGLASLWSLWTGLLLATSPFLIWTSWHVKNDLGALFLLSAGIYFLAESSASVVAGLLFGAAVMAKFQLIFPALLALIYWLATRRQIIPLVAAATAMAIPLLLRNYWLTGNPAFPFLTNLIPDQILPATGRAIFNERNGAFTNLDLSVILGFFFQFLAKDRLAFLGVATLPVLFFMKRRFFWLNLIGIFGVVLGIALMGPISTADPIQLRLLVVYLILPAIGVAAAVDAISLKYLRPTSRALVLVPAFVALLLQAQMPWPAFNELVKFPGAFTYVKERLPGGACKMWFATQAHPAAKLLSLEEDALYLMPEARYFSAFRDPTSDRILFEETDIKKVVNGLKARGITHVLQNLNPKTVPYYRISLKFWNWSLTQGAALDFKGTDCFVLNLDRVILP